MANFSRRRKKVRIVVYCIIMAAIIATIAWLGMKVGVVAGIFAALFTYFALGYYWLRVQNWYWIDRRWDKGVTRRMDGWYHWSLKNGKWRWYKVGRILKARILCERYGFYFFLWPLLILGHREA